MGANARTWQEETDEWSDAAAEKVASRPRAAACLRRFRAASGQSKGASDRRSGAIQAVAPHFLRVPFSVEKNETADPIHVGLLGPDAVVAASEDSPDGIEEFWLRRRFL